MAGLLVFDLSQQGSYVFIALRVSRPWVKRFPSTSNLFTSNRDANTSHTLLRWDEIATLVEAYRNQAATNAAIYIIGAKCDLISTRAVDLATILAFCQKEEVSYFEVSAKNGFNMEPLLETLVNDIYTIQVACLSASPKLGTSERGTVGPHSPRPLFLAQLFRSNSNDN